jgi:hypothetical protein
MRVLTYISLVCFAIASTSVSAQAQQRVQPAPGAPQDGYLIAGGGIAVGPHTGPLFSAEVGEKIGRALQAYVAFQFFDDLMTDSTRDDIAAAGQQFEALTLTPWEFQGRDRGRTLTGGVKAAWPGRVRPYVAGGVGVLNLKRIITERTLGDVSEAFRTAYAVEAGPVDNSLSSTTRPLVEGGLGVGVIVGRVYVDVGYRYRRAFHVFGDSFDFSQVMTSAGIAF